MRHDPKLKSMVKQDGTAIVATTDTKVHIPKYYEERGLLTMGREAQSLGVINVIIDDAFFVVISTLIYTLPFSSFKQVDIGEEVYYELQFKAGQPIIQSLEVAKNNLLAIELLTFMILRAKIPYFIDPPMALQLLSGTSQAAGINLDENSSLVELLISLSHRSQLDTQVLARHAPNDPITYVALTDVNFGTFTNFSRLLNSYQTSGLITSLTNNSNSQPGKLETILRR